MTPDELRALADALSVPHRDLATVDVIRAADYLRAQADAQPVAEVRPAGAILSEPLPLGTKLYTHPAPTAPAGWKWVPVEPTQAMNNAGLSAVNQYGKRLVWETYAAMLAAAPAVPQAEPKRELTADERDVLDSALRSSVRIVARGVAEPKREPLPDHEIVTMYAECPRSDAEMIDFARAIERAHGIGGSDAE